MPHRIDKAGLEAAMAAFLQAESNPNLVPCSHCSGKGYQHGYGEGRADPDWCTSCGGGCVELVDGEEDRPLREAISAYLSTTSEGMTEEQVEAVAYAEDNMPERIWAGDFNWRGLGHCVIGPQGGLYAEYVRADLAAPAVEPVGIKADDRLFNADEPMADGEIEMTAAENVLAWLIIEKIGVPDDRGYSPNEAQEILVRRLDYANELENERLRSALHPSPTPVSAPVGVVDNPAFDGTDGAHPAWWRGNDRGVESMCEMITLILDGEDPSGVCREPVETVRRRVAALRSPAVKGK